MPLKHPIRCLSAGFNHAGSRPVAQEICASPSCSAASGRRHRDEGGSRDDPSGRVSATRLTASVRWDGEAASLVTPSELRTVLPPSVAAMPRPRSQRGQGGSRRLATRRVQHDHRTRVNQPVPRERDQTPRPTRLAVHPHESVSMLVRRHRSHRRDAEHGKRGATCSPSSTDHATR
jgi:hypothetical protein